MTVYGKFKWLYNDLIDEVWRHGEEVEVGEWQSQDVRDKPHMISREMRHVSFQLHVGETKEILQADVRPNLPWAEDHFQERVCGHPLNPPPSEAYWPYAQQGNAAHKADERFSHTYPERMWPKWAGFDPSQRAVAHFGIRYNYGDLMDVVRQLIKNPLTRQAYLPIWFPEDTGAAWGQRVPCTLGYHFLNRGGLVEVVYYIRSCDLLRHFTDDVYMACRLLQWVVEMMQRKGIEVQASRLIMHISSLHVFRGDYPRIQLMIADKEDEVVYGAAV